MAVSTDEGLGREGASLSRLWPGAAVFAAACIAASILLHQGGAALVRAWQVPEYTHGWLIPVISGYLFLRQLKTVPANPGPVTDRWPGVLVLMLALLLGLAGNITQIEKLIAVAIIVWSGGMVLVSFGWARGKQFWPPVLHLCFMLPLPFFLYWKTSIALQFISSELGVAFIRMMAIPVFLDGNIIDLGEFKLHVAEACSGLRYLFPILSFTYIFAVLYQGSYWHKAILLLAAVPITIVMNSIRIGVIGVIVDNYGIEHAEGFMHYFEGWVIFLACILMMIGLARVLQWLARDRRSLVEVLDLETTGLGEQMMRVRDIRPSVALLGSTLAIAAAGLAWSPLAAPPQTPIERDPLLIFPNELGEWRSTARQELTPEIAQVLAADDYLSASYFSTDAPAPVDLFVAWYRDQGKTGGIHSPEVCIPAGGWEMSEIEATEVTVDIGGQPTAIPVNRAIIQKGLEKQLVYYWFDQAGRRITSDYAAKLYLLWDGLQSGRTDGALVRLLTPIGPEEPVTQADARLRQMMSHALPELTRFFGTQVTIQDDSAN
ncbi:MAG: VPLPA-CTERM-specific exosortase XrtD [Pseudomonadota bacterium]